jgi:uncharacterized protein (DUF934 family)
MRRILRRHELVADDWRYAGEEAAAGTEVAGAAVDGVDAVDAALIIPLAELRRDPTRWRERGGRLGVRLGPADAVEELAAQLPFLSLVALEFPNPGDGRGYSQARLLRERFGFGGELRAVGAGVRQDQVFLLARCGFDAIELAAGEDPEAAQRALSRYDVAYQPGSPQVGIRRQRFLAHGALSAGALQPAKANG